MWSRLRFRLWKCAAWIGLWAAMLLSACRGGPVSVPDEVATLERPAVSPSGRYILLVVSGADGEARFQSFRIVEREEEAAGASAWLGETLFAAPERFAARHVTYFLWDPDDRVWVYSGDVGTFFWELDAETGEWEKHVYAEGGVPAPSFLKAVRPDQHPW